MTRLTLHNRIALFAAAMAAGAMAWTLPAIADDPTQTQQQPSGSSVQGTNAANNGNSSAGANASGANTGDRNMSGDLKSPSGMQGVSAADQAGIRDLLSSVTVTALSPDASRNITQYLTDSSRNALSGLHVDTNPNNNATTNRPGNASANGAMANGPAAGGPGGPSENSRGGAAAADAAQHANAKAAVDESDLNVKIEQFRKDWQAKYNQPFDLKDKEVVFNSDTFQILPGDIADQARMAGERIPGAQPETPLKQNTDTKTGVGSGSSISGTNSANTGANAAANASGNEARSATLRVAASHDLPAVEVPLARGTSASQWKVQTPAAMSQQQLHDNLLTQVTAINDAKDRWPSDQNEAYRIVSHRVLLALTSTSEAGSSSHGDMNRGSDTKSNPNSSGNSNPSSGGGM